MLKLFPPSKPNYFYGYQGWNAKSSIVKWKAANKSVSSIGIICFSLLTILSFGFDYLEIDAKPFLFIPAIAAFFLIFYLTERKLKRVRTI